MKRLPTPRQLFVAQDWLRAGCPTASKDAQRAHKILLKLVDAMPSHFPQFCYGTAEWLKAMRIPKKVSR